VIGSSFISSSFTFIFILCSPGTNGVYCTSYVPSLLSFTSTSTGFPSGSVISTTTLSSPWSNGFPLLSFPVILKFDGMCISAVTNPSPSTSDVDPLIFFGRKFNEKSISFFIRNSFNFTNVSFNCSSFSTSKNGGCSSDI